MEFTKAQRDILIKGYENAFNSTDLVERFKTDYKEAFEEMAKEVLVNNGYPENVKVDKVEGLEITLAPNNTLESFADNLAETEKIEDREAFATKSEDINFYIEDILDNMEMVEVQMKFRTEAEEYLEYYPDVKYFSKVMKQKYDDSHLEEMLRDDENFMLTVVDEQATSEGFEDLNVARDNYEISDLKLKKSFPDLAELFINQNVKLEEEKVTDFMRVNFYRYVIKHKLYEAKVKFNIDPNEVGVE